MARTVVDKIKLEEFNTSIIIEDSEVNDFAVEPAIFQCNLNSIEKTLPTQAASKQNPRETNQPKLSTVEIGGAANKRQSLETYPTPTKP